MNKDDVIHASPKDVESIFQVSMSESGNDKKILLAATSKEKTEWMSSLKSLQKKAEEKEGAVRIFVGITHKTIFSDNNPQKQSILSPCCALEKE